MIWQQIYFGLWGYNSSLAGLGVYALIVLTPPSRLAVLTLTAAACAALAFASFRALFHYWGVPCFTLPFCATGVLYAALQPTFDENNRKEKRQRMEAQRAANMAAGRRASIGPQGRRASVGGLALEVAPQFQAHRASIAPTTLSDEMKNFLKNVVPGAPQGGPGSGGGGGAAGGGPMDVASLLAASNLNAVSMSHADAAAAASRLAEANKHANVGKPFKGHGGKKGGKKYRKKGGGGGGADGDGDGDSGVEDAAQAPPSQAPPPQFQPHRASVCEASLSPDMQAAIREALATSAALLAAGAAGAGVPSSASSAARS